MKKRGYPLTTALLALATVAAATGFWRVFTGNTWIVPLLAMVLSIHLLGWWFRRTNTPFSLAVIATMMVIALVSVWAVLPSSTAHGVPWTATWAAARSALDHVGDGVPHPPVHPDAGYMLEALWLVGIGAALADWSAFRVGSALQGIVPAVGIFALCQVLGGSTHGTVLIAGLTGASTAYLLAHRATVGRARATWLGGSPNGYLRSVIRAGAIGVVTTTAVAIGIGSQLPNSAALGADRQTAVRPHSAAPPPHAAEKTVPAPATPTSIAQPKPQTAPTAAPATRSGPVKGDHVGPSVPQHGRPVWPVAVLAALVALAAWIAVNVGYRQMRWRQRRRGDGHPTPAYSVRVAWAELTETLALWNLHRDRAETRVEFGQRVGASLAIKFRTTSRRDSPDGERAELLRVDPPRVAAIADRVAFSDDALPPDLAWSAVATTEEIVRTLRAQASFGAKIMTLVLPRRSRVVGRFD
ncbi:MAG: hypothetical protein ABSC41_02170 [Acidimicrobiales bacterium]|jgi:hypothetical protein